MPEGDVVLDIGLDSGCDTPICGTSSAKTCFTATTGISSCTAAGPVFLFPPPHDATIKGNGNQRGCSDDFIHVFIIVFRFVVLHILRFGPPCPFSCRQGCLNAPLPDKVLPECLLEL